MIAKQFAKANKVMFDDAASVRTSLRKLGIAVIHPKKLLKRLLNPLITLTNKNDNSLISLETIFTLPLDLCD